MARQCPRCATVYDDDVFFCGHDGALTVQEQDPSDFDPRLGTQLGDYVVVARVADGAMGRVYEGRHVETKQRVAVKVLHEDVARDEVAVERFKREYEAASELDHPGIVTVIDFGETDDGSWFLTMEYLLGEELTGALKTNGPLPPARLVRILCQLCDALDYAHSFGFVHRDLKPDNVFLEKTETGDAVRVLDFGSVKLQMETGGAKLTAFGTTLGSPYYMSPEQAMGKLDVDQRTDVFAAAAIAWEMATGQVAFEGGNVAQILMKIVNEDPAPPSSSRAGLPAAFDDAVLRGMKKDKTARPSSAGELALEIAASFGLSQDVKTIAAMPQAEVEQAMSAATPPTPKPYGEVTAPIATESPDVVPALPGGSRAFPVGVAIAAVVGLLAVGGAIAFLVLR